MNHLNPSEILQTVIGTGKLKADANAIRLIILGILAGVFIAFAGFASNTASCNLLMETDSFGVGKILSGTIFSGGLVMVVLAGGELFTGNTLITAAVLDRSVSIGKMIRNWLIVYISNFVGAVLFAFLISKTDLLSGGAGVLGAYTLKVAAAKVNITFIHGFITGLLCNWLVCLAVWISFGADSTIGKIFSMFFPIWIFVTSGFEHSVANMFFIPAGIFVKSAGYGDIVGLTAESLNQLTWANMFVNNLLPVTLGNIVGGALCVAGAYWLSYRKFGGEKR
ncbi:MAG: formate/nitrite transporter family protein [Firmicutes bacterium]|nr:formate/nitrite transporter family protein [Bacillota bacterium]